MSRRLRMVLGIALVLAAVTGIYLSRRTSQPKTENQVVLADTGAPLKTVLCTVNSARRSALPNAALISNIVNALPPRVSVIISVNDKEAFTVASNPWPERVSFLELSSDKDFTIWPQDPFVVVQDKHGQSTLVQSLRFERADDWMLAQAASEHMGWKHRSSTLLFEGGNIVSGERHLFIGANTIRFNAVELNKSDLQVMQMFERELGRPALVLGPVPQPVGHIDMILTPLGEGELMLADPAWGARLAKKQLKDSPETVLAFEQLCIDYFFGTRSVSSIKDSEGKVIMPPDITGMTENAVERTDSISDQLDRIAEEMTGYGYRVHRIPFLYAAPDYSMVNDTGDSQSDDDQTPLPGPGYPYLTYNNVLLERVDGRRTVYLPQYGWPAFDDQARTVWEETGFDVVPVKGLAITAMYGGSLRCCVKVLERY